MSLNPQQQAAVDYLEGPLLVLAGPGTGKTHLLSAKVQHILEVTDANPENILCLTFTEAGAENMRDRLQRLIGQAALNINIYTYHAFGSELLERYKGYAENFDRKIESSIDETTQYNIIASIQKSLPATDILRNAEVKDIIDVITSAKAARLTAADLHKIATQNLEDSNAISAEISLVFLSMPKVTPPFEEALHDYYQPVLDILVKYTSPEPIAGRIERLANELLLSLNQAIEEVATSDPGLTKTGKPKKRSIKPLSNWKEKNIQKYATGGQKNPETAYRLSDVIATKKLFSIAHIMEKYDDYLRTNGLYDYSDMIELAIQYLKTDRGFQLDLMERFQYILLDEFQDTNPSQFELISLLTDYEKPIVMAVGDDDQAIFEFQGANASNLSDFKQYYNAKDITLVNNYRSIGAVLEFSKHIADQITDSFAKKYQNIDKTLHSHRDEEDGAPENPTVERHEFPCSDAEYYWVAHKIRELVDVGEHPQEIAILAPRHKSIIPILQYLKDQHLDVTYEKRDNLLQDEEIRPLLTIARFVQELAENKKPAHRLLEILSYDFWEIPASVIISAVEVSRFDGKTLSYLTGDPRLETLKDFFADLVAVSTHVPLELWFDYLIGATPLNGFTSPFLSYYDRHHTPYEKLELYEKLATFRQTILTHAKSLNPSSTLSAPKLKDFIATLDDYEAAGAEIMRISTYRDSDNAVQVMTAFKSKGLEFKHVFLISVDDSAWGKAKGNNNKLALPKNLASIRHTNNTDDERLRTLFVAITRARDCLYLTNSCLTASGKETHRLAYLNESSRDDDTLSSPHLPTKSKLIHLHADELDPAQKTEAKRLGWIAAYRTLEPTKIEPLLKSRLANYRLTASDLTSFIDLIYAGPQAFYQRRVLCAPQEPISSSICYGNLVHDVFKQVTNQHIDDDTALKLFETSVSEVPLAPDERQDLLEKGKHDLTIALSEFQDILRHPHARGEVEFRQEGLTYDGVPLTGRLDHINIDKSNNTIEVYDFKTGNYHDSGWNSQPSLYKYRLQLAFYKLLLNLSPTYRKYQVTRGHILFVSPDSDERVHDKVYDYNDADDAELKQLAKAVYAQIKSLDFVKNPDLFLPADESNGVRKMRDFAELLISTINE